MPRKRRRKTQGDLQWAEDAANGFIAEIGRLVGVLCSLIAGFVNTIRRSK